jgi:glycosyltransferase involved in cell wall biosynthesis
MSSPSPAPAPGRPLAGAERLVDTAERAPSLRIALVAPPVLPIPPRRYAGTERVVAALADGLVARGHHVTLFASGDSTAGSETVAVLPEAAWSGRSTGDTAIFGMLAAMTALEEADRFDVVHSHVDVMSLPLARGARVPVLTTFHARLDLPGLYEAVLAFRRAPLVAISQSQRRWHPTANWVATIPHGLPLRSMPFSAEPGEYLAVVGRATPEKGIAEAIDVATASGVPLRIAAKARNASERRYLETHVRPALSASVEYLGEVGADERDPLLAGARATLMLGAWPEPFGLVAIESLATGTPVIARRAGALGEIIEHGVDGYLVDDLGEAKLAVNLVAGLDRSRIRERAIARFNVDRMVSDYERVYLDLVAGRTPSAEDGDDGDGLGRPGRRPAGPRPVTTVKIEPEVELTGHRVSA